MAVNFEAVKQAVCAGHKSHRRIQEVDILQTILRGITNEN
jgi:hypothetical protein